MPTLWPVDWRRLSILTQSVAQYLWIIVTLPMYVHVCWRWTQCNVVQYKCIIWYNDHASSKASKFYFTMTTHCTTSYICLICYNDHALSTSPVSPVTYVCVCACMRVRVCVYRYDWVATLKWPLSACPKRSSLRRTWDGIWAALALPPRTWNLRATRGEQAERSLLCCGVWRQMSRCEVYPIPFVNPDGYMCNM